MRLRYAALVLGLGGCTEPSRQLLVPDPDARRVVWAYTSADRETWTRQPEPVAYNMASLGLSTEADGSLLLTGVVEIEPPPWERLVGPPVRGLRFDGTAWSAVREPGGDPEALSYIDPQPFEGGFWYIAPQTSDGDPAHIKDTPTPLRSFPPPTLRFADPGIADPSPIRMPDGSLHVFITHNFNILHLAGDPLRERINVMGANVPFPLLIDGELHLLAQAARGRFREPVIAPYDLDALGEEQITPAWQPLLTRDEQGDQQSCTSPVMAPSPAGGWLLLCVEERIDCSDPRSQEQLDHCKAFDNGLEPEPEAAPSAVPEAPPPGVKGPPQPVDCDYPDAAEKDPRCRGRSSCDTPEARQKYPHCR